MISQSPEKERRVSGAECDTQREKQPLQQQHLRVKILELKGFPRFVYATDLSRLRGFPPFRASSQNAEIYVTLGLWLSKHLVDFQRRASSRETSAAAGEEESESAPSRYLSYGS